MNWKKSVFKNFKLYAVTDIEKEDPSVLEKVEAAYRGGADIVQLRSKNLSDKTLYQIGVGMRKIANRYRKLFFVNDRPDIAVAVEADGVHLGQDDLPIQEARRIVAQGRLFIGRSTHSLKQVLEAEKEGADYIGVGPIFKTPTKPSYKPVGLELIRQVSQKIKIPFVCIGGINQDNIESVLESGARRVAVVRAIFGATDVSSATKNLRKIIDNHEK